MNRPGGLFSGLRFISRTDAFAHLDLCKIGGAVMKLDLIFAQVAIP
jgi:hypothetical protein